MAADLHIHSLNTGGLVAKHLQCFFANTFGSKYFSLRGGNSTSYSTVQDTSEQVELTRWLDAHMGHQLFTVSW